MLGRNDCSEFHFLSGELVIRFAVVARVGKHCLEFDSRRGLSDQPFEFADIWIRTFARFKCKNEMVGYISDDSELGIAAVSYTHLTLPTKA